MEGTKMETKTICRTGHEVEQGKSVSGKGYCNLCVKDAQKGKAIGTTARERGLKFSK